MTEPTSINYQELAGKIKLWGKELGFADVGICDIDLSAHQDEFKQWLNNNYHGSMEYMARHGDMRTHPEQLHPGTIRVLSARMNYLPTNAKFATILKQSDKAYVSRYALGRDYHKLMRNRLKVLAEKIKAHCGELNYRPFVDSAPILERPLAEKAGLGWVGKHSLVLNEAAGSWFFLGEILVDIPLPIDTQPQNQCGACVACIKVCPTNAIVEPYVVDAKRCISYLTIEHQGSIDEELRPLLGNRIYGCDDCQLVCPWNRFGQLSQEKDFQARENLDDIHLLELFEWSEQTFLDKTQGSPIRRIGHQSWQRNIAIALGNAKGDEKIVNALMEKLPSSSELVREHITWALEQQHSKLKADLTPKNQRLTQRLIRTIEKGLPRDS